jgi:tryptophan synthase alpha subunit
LIELGIPFSDPTAEEQVIQDANIRALAGGVTVDKIFDMLKRVRKTCSVPIVFMTYANPVFAYDPDKFLSRCKEVRVDALFIPDLPFEEKEEFFALLLEVRHFLNIHGCAFFQRPYTYDCRRCTRLCLLRTFHGRAFKG